MVNIKLRKVCYLIKLLYFITYLFNSKVLINYLIL